MPNSQRLTQAEAQVPTDKLVLKMPDNMVELIAKTLEDLTARH